MEAVMEQLFEEGIEVMRFAGEWSEVKQRMALLLGIPHRAVMG
jgi:hypothetical protein